MTRFRGISDMLPTGIFYVGVANVKQISSNSAWKYAFDSCDSAIIW